ncbi:hypothetical protein CkP1_0276 [Citrobacter phage CkP1]|nr:hypothetical protein CkP1_0276 [Citrobacter phage CkP1]
MIKSKVNVEMVIYENKDLLNFYNECEKSNVDYYSGVADEISTDLMWVQQNDVIKLSERGDFIIIAIKRSVEELINEIDETVNEYDLEDYF